MRLSGATLYNMGTTGRGYLVLAAVVDVTDQHVVVAAPVTV